MKPDPKAPISSPRHPKNINRSDVAGDDIQPPADELAAKFSTDFERDEKKVPDVAELQRRAVLVDEWRAELAEDPDAQEPTLDDETGRMHVWIGAEDENASYWAHVPVPESEDVPELTPQPAPEFPAPPRSGPGSSADAWREYAAVVTDTKVEQWDALSRDEIVVTLQGQGVLPRDNA